MNKLAAPQAIEARGVEIRGPLARNLRRLYARLEQLQIDELINADSLDGSSLQLRLRDDALYPALSDGDTTQIASLFRQNSTSPTAALEREIILAMFQAPQPIAFPSFEEFEANVCARCHIVAAAGQTQLAFHTSEAERPADYWTYSEEGGFLIKPGVSLIEALTAATQPGPSGQRYAFSCYRATEYVVLLGIAQTLAEANPDLLARITQRWTQRAIKSGRFHDTFLQEYGSESQPLPLRYYVPGDRVWFRNPDVQSSEVSGYEGSWVIYLGGGQFANFWRPDAPYTLESKCVELYHWRDGAYRDSAGEWCLDEQIVEQQSRSTLGNPARTATVLGEMMQWRAVRGAEKPGGCVDRTREFPRFLCPGTAEIILPA